MNLIKFNTLEDFNNYQIKNDIGGIKILHSKNYIN